MNLIRDLIAALGAARAEFRRRRYISRRRDSLGTEPF